MSFGSLHSFKKCAEFDLNNRRSVEAKFNQDSKKDSMLFFNERLQCDLSGCLLAFVDIIMKVAF